MGWFSDALFRLRHPEAPRLSIAGDTGEGPVIVMLHGIASASSTFQNLVPLLEDRYRCITVDLLGFGQSPSPEGAQYTVAEHVIAIEATLRSLKLREPFVLVGHSLGALLGARFAAQHPKLVQRLVLVSPPVYLPPEEIGDPVAKAHVGGYLKLYEFLRTNKDFTIGVAPHLTRLFNLGDMLDVTDRNWNAFVLSLKHCIESQTAVSDIAAVRVPIDVVYGSLDQFIAPGTLRIIEQMRHVTMHRVELHDHIMRPRLARAVAEVIG